MNQQEKERLKRLRQEALAKGREIQWQGYLRRVDPDFSLEPHERERLAERARRQDMSERSRMPRNKEQPITSKSTTSMYARLRRIPGERLTTAELAYVAGVTAATIQNWRKRGIGPKWEDTVPIQYPRSDVLTWLRYGERPKAGRPALPAAAGGSAGVGLSLYGNTRMVVPTRSGEPLVCTLDDAATRLGLPVQDVKSLLDAGRLKGISTGGTHLITTESLTQYEASQPRRPEPTGPGGDEELMTVDDLAILLGLHNQTIYNWRAEGKGPRAMKLDGRVGYRWSDVDEWMARQMDGGSDAT